MNWQAGAAVVSFFGVLITVIGWAIQATLKLHGWRAIVDERIGELRKDVDAGAAKGAEQQTVINTILTTMARMEASLTFLVDNARTQHQQGGQTHV